MNQFENCILCGSSGLAELKGYERDYLVKCPDCSFVFCSRKPSPQELSAHYFHYPRREFLSPTTLKRYHELLDKLEEYKITHNLLDLGCGEGFFLAAAKDRGWNVYGTEFTEEAIQLCKRKGIEMYSSPLKGNEYSHGFFDVITSFEVIEHINYPQEEVAMCDHFLRKGGVVYITTPNFNSISRNVKGNNWSVIEYPEHLSYYTKHTLKKLFSDHGFYLLKIQTTGISINRMTETPALGGARQNYDETIREQAEQNLLLGLTKTVINHMLNVFGKGDSLKAYFQKK